MDGEVASKLLVLGIALVTVVSTYALARLIALPLQGAQSRAARVGATAVVAAVAGLVILAAFVVAWASFAAWE